MRQVWITDEAFEYVRKLAYENRMGIGAATSKALLNNVKGELE